MLFLPTAMSYPVGPKGREASQGVGPIAFANSCYGANPELPFSKKWLIRRNVGSTTLPCKKANRPLWYNPDK